jgi:hypothetical protein
MMPMMIGFSFRCHSLLLLLARPEPFLDPTQELIAVVAFCMLLLLIFVD